MGIKTSQMIFIDVCRSQITLLALQMLQSHFNISQSSEIEDSKLRSGMCFAVLYFLLSLNLSLSSSSFLETESHIVLPGLKLTI